VKNADSARQWLSVGGGLGWGLAPPHFNVMGQRGATAPHFFFTKVGIHFYKNMKFNVKKTKVTKILKNGNGKYHQVKNVPW